MGLHFLKRELSGGGVLLTPWLGGGNGVPAGGSVGCQMLDKGGCTYAPLPPLCLLMLVCANQPGCKAEQGRNGWKSRPRAREYTPTLQVAQSGYLAFVCAPTGNVNVYKISEVEIERLTPFFI